MGIMIDNSIHLLEDYHEWKKQFGTDGSGVDDATNKLLEVAKKYQKIEQIVKEWEFDHESMVDSMEKISEVVEDGPTND